MDFKYFRTTIAALITLSIGSTFVFFSLKGKLRHKVVSIKQQQLHFLSYDDKISDNVCANALSLFHFSNGKNALRVYGLEDSVKYSKDANDKKSGKLVALNLLTRENTTFLQDNDIVVFLDGRDSFCMRDIDRLGEDFANTGKDLFIAAEKNCWPFLYAHFSKTFLNLFNPKTQQAPWNWSFKENQICTALQIEAFLRHKEGPYPFPNSGGFIGRWRKMKDFLQLSWEVYKKMLKDNQREDQSAAALAFLLSNDNSIVLDTTANFIQCWDYRGAFDNYCTSNTTLVNKETGSFPYFHHHNADKSFLEPCMQYIGNISKESASDCFWISGDTGRKIYLKDVCQEQRKCCRFLGLR